MMPTILVMWRCPACRHIWRGDRRVVYDSTCPDCGLRDVEALTWCSNEPDSTWDHRLPSRKEMEAWMDRELAALREMGA